jgi:phosphoribosylformylglycinamidine synthase
VRSAQEAIRAAVRDGSLASAHDVAEGGFLVAVAECCLAGDLGATLDLGASDDVDRHLFGEAPGGFVVSGSEEALRRLGEHVELEVLGRVGGSSLSVTIGGEPIEVPLAELREAHRALAPLFV